MPYTATPWGNGPEGGTPLDADRLNAMHEGISDAHTRLDAITPNALGAAPAVHTHVVADLTNATVLGKSLLTSTSQAAARLVLGAGTSDLQLGPGGAAAAFHNHVMADVTDLGGYLTTQLAAKAPVVHTHTTADLSDFASAIGDKITDNSTRLTALESNTALVYPTRNWLPGTSTWEPRPAVPAGIPVVAHSELYVAATPPTAPVAGDKWELHKDSTYWPA